MLAVAGVDLLVTDDVCPSNLRFFRYIDRVKEKYPDLKVIAFTIANYKNQRVDESKEFKDWYKEHKYWVEIAVHGYDHSFPPEAEREDFEECVEKALEILRPFLPKEYGYRSPGFQFTVRMEPILRKLGFAYVAYRNILKYFDGRRKIPFNTHCCDRFQNPITKIWRNL